MTFSWACFHFPIWIWHILNHLIDIFFCPLRSFLEWSDPGNIDNHVLFRIEIKVGIFRVNWSLCRKCFIRIKLGETSFLSLRFSACSIKLRMGRKWFNEIWCSFFLWFCYWFCRSFPFLWFKFYEWIITSSLLTSPLFFNTCWTFWS